MDQKRLRLATEVGRARAEIVFLDYVQPLGNNISFKYLSRILAATDNHWPELVAKLKKESKNRAHMSWFLGQ